MIKVFKKEQYITSNSKGQLIGFLCMPFFHKEKSGGLKLKIYKGPTNDISFDLK